jgi:hypothetical protein
MRTPEHRGTVDAQVAGKPSIRKSGATFRAPGFDRSAQSSKAARLADDVSLSDLRTRNVTEISSSSGARP